MSNINNKKKIPELESLGMGILVISPGIGHDKIHSEFFATPPRLVAFAIQAPALRTADLQSSPGLGNPVSIPAGDKLKRPSKG